MAYSGNIKGIMRVLVSDSTFYEIEDSGNPSGIREGFLMCKELASDSADSIQNQNVPRNSDASLTWRVLIPHDLISQGSQAAQPSPAYEVGDILYVARLDAAIVLTSPAGLPSNIHPSTDGSAGNVQMVPHLRAMTSHYGRPSSELINQATDCVFWIDLNVDGRTRGGGSGGGGSASVVWL